MIKRCKPEMGECYWFLNPEFEPCMDIYDDRTVDCHRYHIGNRFSTEAEAKAASEKVKELLLALHRKPARAKKSFPKLTAEAFDRPDCPEWAKWVAVDRDRKACFYSRKPKCDNMLQMWLPGGIAVEFKTIRGIKFAASDWQNSLIERPEKSLPN